MIMTEQEKNIIKNEILDQLLSSSKSIDQLSKESRLKDDDLFEINGGRYITGKTIIEACSAGSSLKEYLKRSEADGLYQPIGNYLTQQSLADYYTKTEADARYLSRDLFDSLFELVNRGSEDNPEWVIRAKHSLYTDGWLSGKGPYNGSGADAPPGGGATELRMLDDVLLSDPLSKGDVLSFDGQKWTNAPVQLPSLAGYATEAWVESKGYLTAHQSLADYARKSEVKAVSDRLDDFLTGSDTDTVINKWKELETFLSGMKESDNLATLLSGKVDKRDGYGLSKNDFTDSLLQKLNGIEAGANKYVLPIAKAAVLGYRRSRPARTAHGSGHPLQSDFRQVRTHHLRHVACGVRHPRAVDLQDNGASDRPRQEARQVRIRRAVREGEARRRHYRHPCEVRILFGLVRDGQGALRRGRRKLGRDRRGRVV